MCEIQCEGVACFVRFRNISYLPYTHDPTGEN